jgi:hypothetical protein
MLLPNISKVYANASARPEITDITTMNSLAERFSKTSPLSRLRKTQALADDEEFSDAMWGSQAGFGNIAKGSPSFSVPPIPDVRRRATFSCVSYLQRFLYSRLLSLDCIQTIMPIQIAKSRFSMGQRRSHSNIKAALSSLLIQGLLREAILVRISYTKFRTFLSNLCSFRHCQEGHRDQSLSPGNYGWRRWYVGTSSREMHAHFFKTSRLSILGNVSWNALSSARAPQSRANFCFCSE